MKTRYTVEERYYPGIGKKFAVMDNRIGLAREEFYLRANAEQLVIQRNRENQNSLGPIPDSELQQVEFPTSR